MNLNRVSHRVCLAKHSYPRIIFADSRILAAGLLLYYLEVLRLISVATEVYSWKL